MPRSHIFKVQRSYCGARTLTYDRARTVEYETAYDPKLDMRPGSKKYMRGHLKKDTKSKLPNAVILVLDSPAPDQSW